MAAKPYILIVEDEAAIREMTAFALRGAGFDTAEAEDTRQATECMEARKPDLVLLDWMLPGLSGLELARRLRQDSTTAQVPIIMVTARADEQDRIRGLEIAADDYVTKPFSVQELIARIRAVLRRTYEPTTDEVVTAGTLTIDHQTRRVTGARGTLQLSPTEYKLLHFFATHQERVFSRDQLLTQVWGDDAYIDERTVDVHIRRLRKVLGQADADSYIQTVRSVGYRFSPTTH
ncbi:MAG: phosphate regulon transcriptional regulator PhoB [Gammaproteobacteria bacterium]|nr:phosphate regulon transcriptional regulator PhoB [Gammaproteobacteria bacterium]